MHFAPEEATRDDLLSRLVECYDESGGRPTTRIAGSPLGPIGTAALPLLLAELRSTHFPGEAKRERPKIKAEGYIILQRPGTEEEERAFWASTDGGEAAEVVDLEEEAEVAEEEEAPSDDHAHEIAASPTRSSTYVRGSGSTKARLALAKLYRHRTVWQLAYRILAETDPTYAERYTAIAVTKQFTGSPHIDTENVAPFYGLSLGKFTGGFINVEAHDGMRVYEVDTYERLGKVDGRHPHWVSPHEGERYSIIYYQTSGEVVPTGQSVFADEQPGSERRL